MSILSQLPSVRGRYREQVSLADSTWFRVGGAAEVVFKPEDTEDLAHFLRHVAANIPVTVLGAASNVVIRDGGIDGVLIKLGRGFNQLDICPHPSPLPEGARYTSPSGRGRIEALTLTLSQGERELTALNTSPSGRGRNHAVISGEGMIPLSSQDYAIIEAGAANLDVNVAQFALQHGLGGLEFLSGIPGAIGGALRMNAGAYGSEIKDVLVAAEMVMPSGELKLLNNEEMGFAYRHCSVAEGTIFTRAWLRAVPEDSAVILQRMEAIATSRAESQPIRARTGGSTFRNPLPHKAWELIDAAGLRGSIEGGAMVSEKHCNFLINTGSATAADLERLVKNIIRQVKDHSGIELEPEIKFIGKSL